VHAVAGEQQVALTHRLGAVQVPQFTRPKQPSEIVPQFWPAGQDLMGVQPQTFGLPEPPHFVGNTQFSPHAIAGQPGGADG
jgi:hypothetical protein